MRKIVLMLMLVATYSITLAQERQVSGRVTNADDGSALPGVNVVVKGTTNGTMTDANGNYKLNIPQSGGSLVFSFVGMQTQEVPIADRTVVDVSLGLDVTQLNEVVVTETGYSQDRKFLGSATTIKGSVIERTPMGSLDQSLQGRIAGVLVNSGSGQPGSSANVRIRGVQSISGANSQPLYVVDGVPILGDLSGVNPNDIISTTVLKDGSSGALYGARGANGVIVITTRKGKSGINSIDLRTQFGYTILPKFSNFEMMNTEQMLMYEERLGLSGLGITGPGWVYSSLNPDYALQTEQVKSERDALLAGFKKNNLNYEDILFRNGLSTTNELVASGGNDNSRYFASFNVFDQKGFALGSDFTRYTGRLNLDQKIGKISMNLSSTVVSSETNSNVGDILGNSSLNPFQIIWRAKPYEKVYKEDGQLDFGAHTALAPKTIANAMERAENAIYRRNDTRILGSLSFNYEVLKGLNLKNSFGIDYNIAQGMYSIKPNSFSGSVQSQNSGFHAENVRNNSQVINTTSLTYGKILNNVHEFEIGAYFEAIKVSNNGLGYTLFNLDKRLSETGQGASNIPTTPGQTSYPQNGSGAKSKYGIRSYFATGRYTYKDKYTLNFNVRRDGTSRILNEDNKEILTWSAGLGWDAYSELFLQSQNIITELKFRATYGEVPNIGSIPGANYVLPGALFTVPNYLGPQLPSYGASTAFAGSSIPGLIPTTPGNPNLRIETVQKYNVGFDLGLLNRMNLIVDLYKNTTIDLFVSQPLGATTGFGGTNLPVNAGRMSNKGIEVTLSGDIYKSGDFLIDANWNHSININEIEDLGTVNEYPLGTFLIKKGLPYGSHYTLDYVGADPATGQPVYRKADGTTTFSQADAGQVANFGTFLPKHIGGFGFSAKYKRVQVSSFFTYQFDVVRSNNTWNWITRGIPGYVNSVNQATVLLTEQWQKPGDVKFYPSAQYDKGFTSADLMDAKFLRFREITVSYTFPNVLFAKEIRVYARGQNLRIWSPWKGLDPEDDNNISLQEYPNPRMVVFGLDFSF
ncbi:MAG: SusC/RagA family TonB-linked outer membrane protein [Flammeovirgaceae bacterium]|nr:SusC/RagA family TonB-linked outer membrane protein [Flammeovirgaceae bacterium]